MKIVTSKWLVWLFAGIRHRDWHIASGVRDAVSTMLRTAPTWFRVRRLWIVPVRSRRTAMAWPLPFGGYLLLIGHGKHCELQFEDMIPAERIGVIWHEMGHFAQYYRWKGWKTALMAARYMFSQKWRRFIEYDADLFAISHNRGFFLVMARKALWRTPVKDEAYRAMVAATYSDPADINQRDTQAHLQHAHTGIPMTEILGWPWL